MATRKLKYDDGGATSFKDKKRAAKQDMKLAKITAKTDRIKAGTEPTLYDKAATITGNVAKVAGSAAEVANALKKKPTTGGGEPFKKGGATKKMQMGGAKRLTTTKRPMDLNLKERNQKNAPLKGKKYQVGGSMFRGTPPTMASPAAEMTPKEKRQSKRDTKKTLNYVKKNGSGYNAPTKSQVPAGFVEGRSATPSTMRYKTGGMVNPNAKLQAAKSAGTKGVMAGVNPKAAASKVAKGRSGGTSVAPKKAIPKASYGMSMTKMTKK